jgi:hypothetical protein
MKVVPSKRTAFTLVQQVTGKEILLDADDSQVKLAWMEMLLRNIHRAWDEDRKSRMVVRSDPLPHQIRRRSFATSSTLGVHEAPSKSIVHRRRHSIGPQLDAETLAALSNAYCIPMTEMSRMSGDHLNPTPSGVATSDASEPLRKFEIETSAPTTININQRELTQEDFMKLLRV